FFGHPEVYIVLFPAIGLVGDILPTLTRRPLYGSKYITMSMIAAAIISFMVWGHHMFITGINPQVTKLFTLTTIAVSLPFDVITISMIETLVRAKIRLKAPALFAIGSIALFIIGGITGVFLASVALDTELRGTYFVVAHFHYVMVGGAIMALIGGVYYWFPKMTGKMYDERMARIHFILSFIGFNVLYFPMFLLLDMPRRIFTYPPETGWGGLNSISTVGAFVFGLAQILLFVNIWRSRKLGTPVGPNPWESWTLEWAVSSPPPIHNFETIPTISSDGVVNFSGSTPHGVGDGHASQPAHLSQWPIAIALASFLFLLGLTTSRTPPNLLLLIPGIVVGLGSLYGYGRETFVVQEDENLESWPFQKISRLKLGVWTFLASEVILFGVLIGAYLFVRLNPLTMTWPAVGTVFNIQHGATNTFILLTSSLTVVMAVLTARSGSRTGLIVSLLATLGLGTWFLYNKAIEWEELAVGGIFTSHPLTATSYYITTGVHGIHVFAGLAMIAYLLVNAFRRKYLGGGYTTVQHFGLYWHFVDIVWVFLFPLFYLI
ncbi:MAG: cbb3-type cytochrome c oxidase subunit I, partial [Thermoproteota archaeon]